DGILNTIKNYLGKVSNEASNLVPDFLNPIKEVNKLKDSYSQYAQNNPDTPNILKPLGYALETPFRNPLVNNILGSAAKTVGGENAIADNAPIKQYSNSTGNKAIDTVGNYAGDMLGLLSTPITGIGTTTNKNLLNGADEIANLVSGKVASKLPDPLSNTLTTSLINGGINGGLGNALNSVRLNQNLSDTGKSALEGAIGGGLMFGSANLLGKAGSKLLNSNSLSDALTTSKNTIEDTIKNPTGTFKPTSSNKPIINTNELKTSENPPQSELNILNPKGKSFTQTILKDNIVKTDGYKTTLPIENRTPKNVGNKKVKAISYEYAELKPYLQNEAKQVLDELNSSTKGVRQVSYNNITGETAVAATKKNVSSTIQNIQNDIVNKKTGKTTVSYDQIRKGLEDIIHDNGRENNAVSKKIELSLDYRLTYGGADTLGNEVLPQTDYILTKADIEDLQNGTFKTGQAIIKKPITQKGINTLPTLEKPLSKALNENKTINPSIGATDRTKLNVDFTTGDNKQKLGLIANAKNSWDNFYTHAIDINNPIKKVDEKAYVIATNSKKASGTVSHILHDNLVDMKGNPIGEGLKSIAQDIPKNEEPDFFNYVFQRHNVDRAREGKNIDSNFTSEQSQKAVKLIEMKHPEYKALGDRLVNFTNKFMDAWGNKSGLVSDELWKNLQDTYKNYITSSRDFTDLEKGSVSANGKKGFVNQSSGLKKATGSDRNIINPIVNLSNLVDSTVRRARYNEVGQKLLNYAENNPTNESVVVIRNPDNINSNVNNIVSVLENGEKKYLEINDKNLLDALNNIYKSNDLNGFEQGLKTANNAFKSLITTKNPVFAFRNIARDVPTAYINGNENNPIKFFKDLGSAGKDIIKNSADYQKYKALGGESSNFFSPDNAHKTAQQLMDRKLLTDENVITGSKPINPVKKTLNKIGDKVEVFNNLTESVPRYAEFKRTLNKTGDVQKALYDAGEVTTNFSRGGDVTKKLDLGIPYLNAGVQGLDKLARQAKDKPLQTALKGATIVTAPTLILDAV
ncbi:MAG: hypothetical protein Q8936_24025, partial [Bacillota bacterium]|nr:hypothetical protein [Bacillota bacterium]